MEKGKRKGMRTTMKNQRKRLCRRVERRLLSTYRHRRRCFARSQRICNACMGGGSVSERDDAYESNETNYRWPFGSDWPAGSGSGRPNFDPFSLA